jgi:hypothetical protein
VLEEAKGINKTWTEIKADAKSRVRWKILVEALCSAAEWRDANIIIIIIIIIAQKISNMHLVTKDYKNCSLNQFALVVAHWASY